MAARATALALGATWLAAWSWSGLTEADSRFLFPLLVLAVVVGGIGLGGRRFGYHVVAVALVQLAASITTLTLLYTRSLPTPDGVAALREIFQSAIDSSRSYAAPVPATQDPGVHPLLLAGGAACLIVSDTMISLRKPTLVGLPLLAIYSIAVSLLGTGVSWLAFAIPAAAYLVLIAETENRQLSRWGRRLGSRRRPAAVLIGGLTLVATLLLPALVPVLRLDAFGFGRGEGQGNIQVTNPMTDLRRDLVRGEDRPVLSVSTTDPQPNYLRIAVLSRFNGDQWTAGDREIPVEQGARGPLPPVSGLRPQVPRDEFGYGLRIEDNFESRWLPTMAPLVTIDAPGDWRYDTSTMDFVAAGDDLTTEGLTYSMTGIKPRPTAQLLATAGAISGTVPGRFIEVPSSVPAIVGNTARQVTRDVATRFEKAVALQQFFRRTGGFTYSLDAPAGNGSDTLESFLTEGPDGRIGYCEQFASAMAVMARTLGIPARVAVGFLEPELVESREGGSQTWVYSTHDLHAWPELYFEGAGWIRFEPTPGGRAQSVPAYTRQRVETVPAPSASPSGQAAEDLPERASASPQPSAQDAADQAGSGNTLPWGWLLSAAGVIGSAVLVLTAPQMIRRAQRRRRWARLPAAEAAWQELRAEALDHGVPWPTGLSARRTAALVSEWFGSVDDTYDLPERPARGSALAPTAVAALERIQLAVEQGRYARGGSSPSEDRLHSDVRACAESWWAGSTASDRRRARWWPRSIVAKQAGDDVVSSVESDRAGHLVDHVG